MKVDQRLYSISPFWAKKLEKIRGVSGLRRIYPILNLSQNKLQMNKYASCVVGEAYGFSPAYTTKSANDYYCKVCEEFASQFNVHDGETTNQAIPRFELLIEQFCNHVDKVHRK